ncbi:hypothetical protein ATCC90586_000964 [Pythium insidiosum]|nr:hypothetical protein ATCC90586_000964 [Pythium insidiosum]
MNQLLRSDSNVKRERDEDEVDENLLASLHETPSDARKQKTEDDDKSTSKRWTPEQDDALRKAVEEFGQRNWKSIASRVPGRNHAQCLQRWNKVLKPGLVKGHWSYEEDSILERMVLQGCHSWSEVSANIPGRTAKQCRERWRNHLDPSINKAPFTPQEDMTIQQAYESLGNRWTQIAELLPGRTEDAVKVRWKALNPNQKTNAKPGRPRLMPGMPTGKNRSTAPPNPDDVAATLMGPPVPQIGTPMYGYPAAPPMYDPTMAMPVMDPSHMGLMPNPAMTPQHAAASPVNVTYAHEQPPAASHEFPEPSVEPLGDDVADVTSKDAAILKELLRSHSNSLLSFGSTRGLGSLQDMSPDELLASGELDEMLKAISLANNDGATAPDASLTASATASSARSSLRLSSSLSDGKSLSKLMESLGSQDRHIFQDLIDELRSTGGGAPGQIDSATLPQDPNVYNRIPSGIDPSLLHSLDYEDRQGLLSSSEGGLTASLASGLTSNTDLDDLLDSDLMRPIRKGRKI